MAPAESGVPCTVRCAVYTRKSTEEGLVQGSGGPAQETFCDVSFLLRRDWPAW
jgi:hypothetical protein